MAKKWTPHAYQKRAMKFLLENGAAGLFLDPGLGKTSVSLGALKVLFNKKMAKKVLIIAPLRVIYEVWPEEIRGWLDFNHFRVAILHGPKKDEALASDADIYLINPEGLDWLTQAKKVRSPRTNKISVTVDMKRWKKLGFDTLIIDELSKFKHIGSVRFKTMKIVRESFSRIWGLTGSPAANGLGDLFGQCYVLDGGRCLGQFVTHFRAKYFLPDPSGFGYSLQKDGAERIYERIKPLVMRMAAEDYLELPKRVNHIIEVELPPKVRRIYDSMEEDMLALLDGKLVTAGTAGIASIKCRQIVAGGLYDDPEIAVKSEEEWERLPKAKRTWTNLHTAKIDALADLIDELQGSPLLVAYDFHHDLDRLKEKFGQDAPVLTGSPQHVKELVAKWNAGLLPYLFVHPMSAGHGLNLQKAANHVCWLSMTWDYELYDQLIRRVFRQGNKATHVFVHHILAKNTIDQVIWGTIQRKEKGQQALFDALTDLRDLRRRRSK